MALILLSGALANRPFNGGGAWVRLSWLLGLQRLGYEVLFVEQLDGVNAPDQARRATDSPQVQFFRQVVEQFNLHHHAALLDSNGRTVVGLPAEELRARAASAAALINISGHLQWAPLKEAPRTKVYLDLDPGYTQYWQEQGTLGARLEGHDSFYTVGEGIGTDHCSIPTGGRNWRPVRQPVVLDLFPAVETPSPWRFTTIASWRGVFGPLQAGGRILGQKVHEFRKFAELPQRVEQRFEIALDIHPSDDKDRALLQRHGWRVVCPRSAACDPLRFRHYIQRSGAEFSVAQQTYVATNSGWFSDRTVRYLASGKPALLQDTGFSRYLPVGEGLLAFSSLDEAAAGAEAIAANYQQHCRAARQLAERYFGSDEVLTEFLEQIGVGPSGPRRPAANQRRASGNGI